MWKASHQTVANHLCRNIHKTAHVITLPLATYLWVSFDMNALARRKGLHGDLCCLFRNLCSTGGIGWPGDAMDLGLEDGSRLCGKGRQEVGNVNPDHQGSPSHVMILSGTCPSPPPSPPNLLSTCMNEACEASFVSNVTVLGKRLGADQKRVPVDVVASSGKV
jgi:hypothetical protein